MSRDSLKSDGHETDRVVLRSRIVRDRGQRLQRVHILYQYGDLWASARLDAPLHLIGS